MKALLLSLLIVIGLDQVVEHGAGLRACSQAVMGLLQGTRTDVGDSVYRR